MTHAEFYSLTPDELSARCRAARRRRNREIALTAWSLANIMATQTKDGPSPRDLMFMAPGFDPDSEEM